jgi:hypothetical protein
MDASNVQVTINSCDQIDFDGVNDYITFKDNMTVPDHLVLRCG